MNLPSRSLFGGVAIALTALTAIPAAAQTKWLLDFGASSEFRSYSAAASAPAPVFADTNGNSWNNVLSGTFNTGLLDTAGNTTSLSTGYSTGVGFDSFNGPAGDTEDNEDFFDGGHFLFIIDTDINDNPEDHPTDPGIGDLGGNLAGPFDYAVGVQDIVGVGDDVLRFDIFNLNPTSSYELKFFGSRKFATPGADTNRTRYAVYSDNMYSLGTDNLLGAAELDIESPVAGDPGNFAHNRDTVATVSVTGAAAWFIELTGGISASGTFGTAPGYINAMSILEIPAVSPNGDYNGDLVVDELDYVFARESLGVASGDVDADVAEFIANFGAAAAVGPVVSGVSAVPEPASACLLIGMMAGWRLRRTRCAR